MLNYQRVERYANCRRPIKAGEIARHIFATQTAMSFVLPKSQIRHRPDQMLAETTVSTLNIGPVWHFPRNLFCNLPLKGKPNSAVL
jgi:hypothetical protein